MRQVILSLYMYLKKDRDFLLMIIIAFPISEVFVIFLLLTFVRHLSLQKFCLNFENFTINARLNGQLHSLKLN